MDKHLTNRNTYSGLSIQWPYPSTYAKRGQTGWWSGEFFEMPDGRYYYQNREGTFKLVQVNSVGAEPDPPPKERKVSTVEICDRCGAIGKDEVMTLLNLSDGGKLDKDWGICSICRVDFDGWMALATNLRAGTSVTTKYVDEPKISEETRMLARVVAEEFARARENAAKQITNGD